MVQPPTKQHRNDAPRQAIDSGLEPSQAQALRSPDESINSGGKRFCDSPSALSYLIQ